MAFFDFWKTPSKCPMFKCENLSSKENCFCDYHNEMCAKSVANYDSSLPCSGILPDTALVVKNLTKDTIKKGDTVYVNLNTDTCKLSLYKEKIGQTDIPAEVISDLDVDGFITVRWKL